MNKFFKSLAVFMLFSLVLFTVSCTATPEINTVNADAFAQKLNDNGNKAWSASAKYSYMHFHGQRRFDIQIPAKSWDGTLEFYNDRGGWEKITGKRTIPSRSYYFKLNGKSYSYAILIRGKDNTTITGGKAENGWKLSNNIQVIGGGLQALLTYGKPSDVTAEQFAYIFGDVNGHKNITKADFATVGYTESVAKLADINKLDNELSASMPSSGTPIKPLTGTSPSSSPKSFPTSELDTSRAIDGKYGPNKVKDVVSLGYVVFESDDPFTVKPGAIKDLYSRDEKNNPDRVKPLSYNTDWKRYYNNEIEPVFEYNTNGAWVKWVSGPIVAVKNGNKYQIKFRGDKVKGVGEWKVKDICGGDNVKVEVSGDLRDLLNYKNHDDIWADATLKCWLYGQVTITKLPNDIIVPYTSKKGSDYLLYAFKGTSISVAPNFKAEFLGCEEIRSAFSGCPKLTSGGIIEVENLGGSYGYESCWALDNMYFDCGQLVNPGVIKIVNTNGYKHLLEHTFNYTSLRALPAIELDEFKQLGYGGFGNNFNSLYRTTGVKYSTVQTKECPYLFVATKKPIKSSDIPWSIEVIPNVLRDYNNICKLLDGSCTIYTNVPVIK